MYIRATCYYTKNVARRNTEKERERRGRPSTSIATKEEYKKLESNSRPFKAMEKGQKDRLLCWHFPYPIENSSQDTLLDFTVSMVCLPPAFASMAEPMRLQSWNLEPVSGRLGKGG